MQNTKTTDYLLRPGTTYLLATLYNPGENWYTLHTHPNAREVIASESNATNAQLRVLAAQDEKVRAFEEAYPNEVLSKADIGHKQPGTPTPPATMTLPATDSTSPSITPDQAAAPAQSIAPADSSSPAPSPADSSVPMPSDSSVPAAS